MNEIRSWGRENPEKNENVADLRLFRKILLKWFNPAVYRNEIWLKSKQVQKCDYFIAATLQYEVGDKCHIKLDHNGKFSNADIHDFHSENVKKKHKPKNLKTPPPEIWNIVSGKKVKKTNSDMDYSVPKQDWPSPGEPGKGRCAPSSMANLPCFSEALVCWLPGVLDQGIWTASSRASLTRDNQALGCQAREDVTPLSGLPSQGHCTPSSMASLPMGDPGVPGSGNVMGALKF